MWLLYSNQSGTRDQIPNIPWIIEKAREFRKTSTSALLTWLNPLTVWIEQSVGNSERDGNTRPPDLPLEKPVMQVRKQQLELDMNNRLVSNRKRRTSRLYIVILLI